VKHSGRIDQRPSFQFYPADWLAETGLRMCSLGARGLWMECLCIAFNSPERGVLRKQNASSVESKDLARMVGASEDEIEALLLELEAAGVFSRAPDGAIYSRRMIRDEKFRAQRAEAGRLGGIAGAKYGILGGRPSKTQANVERETPPSSSSSTSTTKKTTTKNPQPSPPDGVEFELVWRSYPNTAGRTPAEKICRALVKSRKATWAQLATASSNYAASVAGKDRQYVKHGSTFFGPKEHWRDFLEDSSRDGAKLGPWGYSGSIGGDDYYHPNEVNAFDAREEMEAKMRAERTPEENAAKDAADRAFFAEHSKNNARLLSGG
jgi:hypothetical protein